MTKKRWSFALAGLAATSLMLAGCSTPAESAAPEGPVTLTYWDFLDPSQDNPRANALKTNIAAF